MRCRRFRCRYGDGEEPPLPGNRLESQFEADLQRSCRKEAGKTRSTVGIQRGRSGELRSDDRHGEEIEITTAQISKNLGKISRRVFRLEVGGGQVVQHRV